MVKPKVTLCVTCVGGRLIYDIIHALRDVDDFDIKIIGVDASPDAPGRLLCDACETVPMAETEPEKWLARFDELCRRHRINALLPLSEGESRLVSQHSERLQANNVRSSVSDWETVSIMTDKLLMLQRLVDRGLDAGAFEPVDDQSAISNALVKLGYPERKVVLKPRQGRGSRGVLICDSHRRSSKDCCRTVSAARAIDALLHAMEAEGDGFDDYLAVPYYGGPVSDVDCIARRASFFKPRSACDN